MVGSTISHYKIIEKLGEGGMGVVYKAEDIKLKRIVALKFLPPSLTRDPQSKERFIQEAQSASALQHVNICTIHEIDETGDGHLFIVMDYYNGETLRQKIVQGAVEMNEAMDLTLQIAKGIARAHEAGIIHRDIKPENIIITKDGVVKIIDFGVAKLIDQSVATSHNSTVGTVAYMSPEQIKGGKVDVRSDIFAFGMVLYEMITGQLPFQAHYLSSVLYAILNEVPKDPVELRPDLHRDLSLMILRMLNKKPEYRYQTMSEVLEVFITSTLRREAHSTPQSDLPGIDQSDKKFSSVMEFAPSKKKILIVEDELPIAIGLKSLLEHENYEVYMCNNGTDGIATALSVNPDLAVLDLNLPDLSGFEICRELRIKKFNMPVIMLTASGDQIDKVIALDAGADDYVTKPFENRELLARIRAHLRRQESLMHD